MPRFHIPFMKYRFIMLGFAAFMVVASIGLIAFKGLTYGIEFRGGTVIDVVDSGNVTIEQVRSAFNAAGVRNAEIQTTSIGNAKGFVVRAEITDPQVAAAASESVAKALKMPGDSFQVTTIGPGWGKNVTNRSMIAMIASVIAILLYVAVRFDYKMSVTAILSLVHDITVTLGIYALAGREVTPNTIAALLTILGYSLYDTIVVFHRIKENSATLQKQTFMDMANESINEVFVRSLNTTITSLIPVLALLFFGGETLKDFAFALSVGLFFGAYSSIGIAAPLYVMWREVEPKFQALKKKYASAQ